MSRPKYKRRRYDKDVVIYTTEAGHHLTINGKDYPDPWKKAEELLTELNKE